ncbi:hypothetical protein BJ165DRAFT_1479206 [Panaeolus papilionaceus]|nr:hypothetical protein BJ165DRAFT_1479206 [Panaeolus papilionaceus]
MGATGVGKTTFISAIKSSFPGVSSKQYYFDYGRVYVVIHTIKMGSFELVLIDTPGIDDASSSYTEIAGCISKYLENTCHKDRIVNGLIYLHRISDVSFEPGAGRALDVFRELYDSKAYNKLALVTTIWNDITPALKYQYAINETELKETWWGAFLKGDDAAVLARFDTSVDDEGRGDSLEVIHELTRRSLKNQLKQTDMQDEIGFPMIEAGWAAFSRGRSSNKLKKIAF